MRLLNTHTRLVYEFTGKVPVYAILSHTWGDDEVSLEHIKFGHAKQRKAFSKLLGACEQAMNDHYEWLWIDTCCIDKTSPAELQEAINSMYEWYKNARWCYVYLSDVPNETEGWKTEIFGESRWWSRGWTLRKPSQVAASASLIG